MVTNGAARSLRAGVDRIPFGHLREILPFLHLPSYLRGFFFRFHQYLPCVYLRPLLEFLLICLVILLEFLVRQVDVRGDLFLKQRLYQKLLPDLRQPVLKLFLFFYILLLRLF